MENNHPAHHIIKRRWFLKGLLGVGGLAAVGKAVDLLLPRTLCRPGEWHGPLSDHFNGSVFYNDESQLPDYGGKAAIDWAKKLITSGEYPIVTKNRFLPKLTERVEGKEWEVTMVNHATLLIRLAGLNILTDPVWSDYTSPVQGIGPKRTRPPGIEWSNLPHIDICLLTHDHYDHFDVNTLRKLNKRDAPLFIVPLGLRSLLEYHINSSVRIEEKDWWEAISPTSELRITLTPARHWSKRYRTQETANRSLWCGFYLQAHSGPSLYFSGDTSNTHWFRDIQRRLGSPDVALLSIGAYKPDWLRNNHTSPSDAVHNFQILNAQKAIGFHFGTWQLGQEGYQETLEDLALALREANIAPERFIAPENGQTLRGTI